MSHRRVGVWLVGAMGGVGTTITLGLAALKKELASTNGLTTGLPMFSDLDLVEPGEIVVGGHEIRKTTFADSAREFARGSGVFESSLIDSCADALAEASSNVRPSPRIGISRAVAKLGDWGVTKPLQTPREAVDLIIADLEAFTAEQAIDHLIVLNVASTEPPFALKPVHQEWRDLQKAIKTGGEDVLPSSALSATAAIELGATYINFTPSLGASLPALAQLAEETGSCLAGKDGKTGETLLKTVLAPMFAARNLEVMSWVGHNIFGNRDGVVLDDPANKASKVDTKDKVVSSILGYKPNTLVTIEYIPDMGDWKTAWDHVHFRGFLGAKMAMQFTWQGCDSLLAAPLAIDLVRLCDWEKRRGGKGLFSFLSCFFKSPEGSTEHDFFKQYAMLESHIQSARAQTAGSANHAT